MQPRSPRPSFFQRTRRPQFAHRQRSAASAAAIPHHAIDAAKKIAASKPAKPALWAPREREKLMILWLAEMPISRAFEIMGRALILASVKTGVERLGDIGTDLLNFAEGMKQ